MRSFGLGLLMGCVLLAGCVPLPLRLAPATRGRVVDARTGKGIGGALVVVRYEARVDRALPERRLLGTRELRTGPGGYFEAARFRVPGLAFWPWETTQVRIAAVLASSYRCARPHTVQQPNRPIRIELTLAESAVDRRDSCPEPGADAPRYAAAWQRLADAASETDSEVLAGMLGARALLGFGANCRGPVADLALAPDGRHAAFSVLGPDGLAVRVVRLTSVAPKPRAELVARASGEPPRRLAWTLAGELVLLRTHAALRENPLFGSETIWRAPELASPPAAIAPESGASVSAQPAPRRLAPPLRERNDEAALRWAGRSFRVLDTFDPLTGGTGERLEVTEADGRRRSVPLPGEACAQNGRFGQPQDRIDATGRFALDLRFVDGGCHVMRIDLETGKAVRLDAARSPATCRRVRRIPEFHLQRALHGYAEELEERLVRAGLDPESPFSLRIARSGGVRLETRDFAGRARSLPAPRFPLETPLRRLIVAPAGAAVAPFEQEPGEPPDGGGRGGAPPASPAWNPL